MLSNLSKYLYQTFRSLRGITRSENLNNKDKSNELNKERLSESINKSSDLKQDKLSESNNKYKSSDLKQDKLSESNNKDKSSESNNKDKSSESNNNQLIDLLNQSNKLSTETIKLSRKSIKLSNIEFKELSNFENLTINLDNMSENNSKFNQLCKQFEIRLENSVKLVKNKALIKNKEINETIIIDDETEIEFTNLITKNRTSKKKSTKNSTNNSTTKLFRNVTNKVQNNQKQTTIEEAFKIKRSIVNDKIERSIENEKVERSIVNGKIEKSNENKIKRSIENGKIVKSNENKVERSIVNCEIERSIANNKIKKSINKIEELQIIDEIGETITNELIEQQYQIINEIQKTKSKKIDNQVENLENLEIIENLENIDLNIKSIDVIATDDKAKFKNLKPDNFRIQQVIKEQDLVYFDVETGGMGTKEDILQIGAVNYEGKQFNMYATPTKPIPGMSSRIHHITYKDNVMYYRKNPVPHHSILEVLLRFLDYLEQTKSNNIVLVAHNANFDRRFIIDKLFNFNLHNKLNAKVIGFLDTLPLFRRLIPGRETYKQDKLIYSFFPQTKTDFHNALTDVIYLRKLFEKVALKMMKNDIKYLNDFSQTIEYGLLKKEQQLFEEMNKKKATKSAGQSKKRKAPSGIFINGEHQPKKTKSAPNDTARRTRSTSNEPTTRRRTRSIANESSKKTRSTANEPARRSKRFKK